MVIQRPPHMVITLVWAGLLAAALAIGIVGLSVSPWWSLGVSLTILGFEVFTALYDTPLRTTLSEVTTWFNRQLSKHEVPLRGWNSLVAVQAVVLGRMVYVTIVSFGGPESKLFAVLVGGVFALGQHDHWLSPPTHG